MTATKTKKILLVEDDQINGSMYDTTIKASGMESSWVIDGEKAMAVLKKTVPDIILLDIRLENSMDGFEVLKRVKADKRLKDVPVWLLTNVWERGNHKRGTEMGAEEFIVKSNMLPMDLIKKVKARLGTA